MSEHMIVDTTIAATGNRSVQMWIDDPRATCVAIVYLDNGSAVEFIINSMCPRDLVDEALALYSAVREGRPVGATHTITWGYGQPAFQPLDAIADGLLDLGVLS